MCSERRCENIIPLTIRVALNVASPKATVYFPSSWSLDFSMVSLCTRPFEMVLTLSPGVNLSSLRDQMGFLPILLISQVKVTSSFSMTSASLIGLVNLTSSSVRGEGQIVKGEGQIVFKRSSVYQMSCIQ